MITFREFLNNRETKKFYDSILENDIESKLLNSGGLSKVPILIEAIIRPENIKVQRTDIDYLNNEYLKSTDKEIYSFIEGDTLRGSYDPILDKIEIIVPKDVSKDELSAMIGHESIHRIQNQKSKGKFNEITEKRVEEINKLVKILKVDPIPELIKEYDKKIKFYLYGNPEEQMAYAYQFVKDRNSPDYNFKTPSDIVKYIKQIRSFKLDNRFKKYIGMYWLIKDHI